MLSSMNMFFHIKGFKILAMKLAVLTFMIKVFIIEDQPILGQPLEVILRPYDNAENNNNNN